MRVETTYWGTQGKIFSKWKGRPHPPPLSLLKTMIEKKLYILNTVLLYQLDQFKCYF